MSCLLLSGCGSRSGLLGDGDAVARPEPEVESTTPLLPEVLPPEEVEPQLEGCVDRTLSYDTLPPTVLFLIDQSGSMRAPFGGGSRWGVLRRAIVDETDGVLGFLDQSVRTGITLYSSIDGYRNGGVCPMLTEVPVAFGNSQAIRQLYLASEPLDDGDTPTGDALNAAIDTMLALPDQGPRYIVLLTDGEPDTCAQPDPQNGGSEALAAAQRAYENGVRLYTVGISNEISRWRIQGLANVAAGKPAGLVWGTDAEAERPLFASDDQSELAAQLRGVLGDVRSCNVELGATVGAVRAGQGQLRLDGQDLRYQTPDGWSFKDDDTVEIHGAACDSILGEGHRLEVYFPCVEVPREAPPPR